MPTTIRHSDQFKRGKLLEAWLDDYFSSSYKIERTSDHEERRQHKGDRVFRRRDNDRVPIYVEYKSGIQTAYTGNLFIETVSVDTAEAPGWLYTSQADLLIYATVLNGCLLIFRPWRLRQIAGHLKKRYREVGTSRGQNSYTTMGLLVPFEDAEMIAAEVMRVSPERVNEFKNYMKREEKNANISSYGSRLDR